MVSLGRKFKDSTSHNILSGRREILCNSQGRIELKLVFLWIDSASLEEPENSDVKRSWLTYNSRSASKVD